RAHAAYEQLADPIGAARVASRLADIDFNDGHPPQAAARLEPALAALEEAGAEADIAAVAAQLGRFLYFSGDAERAAVHLERALELARKVGDRRWESQFLGAPSGVLMMLGRWDEALDLAAEAEEIAETEFARALLLQLAPIHVYRGNLDRVRELLAENESIA